MDEKHRETKELEDCTECAEYGSEFCDQCLEEMKRKKHDEMDSSPIC